MRKIFFGALVALFAFIYAYAYELPKPNLSLSLYPEGQTVDKGIFENGKQITQGPLEPNLLEKEQVNRPGDGFILNISDPYIEIYLPEKSNANGQMIVICPGGGYAGCSAVNEGSLAADWCVKNGIAACVVLYRMPNTHCKVPLQDVQNAFRYCRAHAESWGVEQIGIMGFSAGGHLAAYASTLYIDEITRPDFAVLLYPVISFEEFITHNGTRRNLIGSKAGKNEVEFFSLENRVDANTPPAILFLSQNDKTVPPENSIRYYQSMLKFGVPGELHIYTTGGHGWGFSTVENSGGDLLDERAEFDAALKRWLDLQIKK